MTMAVTHDLRVCVDCLLALANGESSSDTHDQAFAAGVERMQADGGHVVPGDSDNDHEFSWSQCDLCLSRLGGSRHDAHVIAQV